MGPVGCIAVASKREAVGARLGSGAAEEGALRPLAEEVLVDWEEKRGNEAVEVEDAVGLKDEGDKIAEKNGTADAWLALAVPDRVLPLEGVEVGTPAAEPCGDQIGVDVASGTLIASAVGL